MFTPNQTLRASQILRAGQTLRGGLMVTVLVVTSSVVSAAPSVDVVSIAAATVEGDVASIPLRLSVVSQSVATAKVQRMIVRIRPRNHAEALTGHERGITDRYDFGMIMDYSPRTLTGTVEAEPTMVRTTREQTAASGLAVDGVYGSLATAHLGMDQAGKHSQTLEAKHLPKLSSSITSGTFDRGMGVMFRLDASSQFVIEGERRFELSTVVGSAWRGGLVDVDIEVISVPTRSTSSSKWASAMDPLMPGNDTPEMIRSTSHFTVAVYRAGDAIAASDAAAVADGEIELYNAARTSTSDRSRHWTRRIGDALDFSGSNRNVAGDRSWIERLVRGAADPHMDSQINNLPMRCRLAAGDYVDARDRLVYGDLDDTATHLASWVRDSVH